MIDNTIPFERAPFIGGTEEDVKTIINSLTPLEENMKKYGRR
jgi:hypothetical protein